MLEVRNWRNICLHNASHFCNRMGFRANQCVMCHTFEIGLNNLKEIDSVIMDLSEAFQVDKTA